MSATQPLPDESDYVPAQIEFAVQGIMNKQEGDTKEMMKAFGKLTNDRDRFFCVAKLNDIDNCLGVEADFKPKDADEAQKSRLNGNKHFKEKSYLTAAWDYSKSVVYAPQKKEGMEDWVMVSKEGEEDGEKKEQEGENKEKEGREDGEKKEGENKEKETGEKKDQEKVVFDENELAIAFANRSACWFHLNRFRFTLGDIDLAFEYNYPKDLHFKLYDRKAKCYVKAGKKDLAVENFQKAKEALKLTKLKDKALEKWENDIEKQIAACAGLEPQKEKCIKGTGITDIPKITGGEYNEKFKAFSKVVDVHHKSYQGRYVVAQEDIRIGDVVMVEKPYESVLLFDHYYNHCYTCYSRPWAPVPCPGCSAIIYCSHKCQQESWDKYHRFECRYQTFLNRRWAGRLGHLALRIMMKTGMKRILEVVEEFKDASDEPESVTEGFDPETQTYDDGFRAIFTLSGMTKTRTSEGLCDYAIYAYFLVKLLRHMGWIAEQARQDKTQYEDGRTLCKLGGAFIRILQVLQNNSTGIIEQSSPGDFEKPSPEEIGNGIYTCGSLINHSCHANVDLMYYGDSAILRACRGIKKGEEVNIEYLGLCFLYMEFERRTVVIRANFGFKCECKACKEKWGKWQALETELPWFICINCNADIDITDAEDDDKHPEIKMVRCLKCGTKQDVHIGMANLQTSHDQYAKGMDMCLSNKHEEALPYLVDHMRTMQTYLGMPWKDLAACQSAVRQCYRMQANVRNNFTDTEAW